MHFAYTRPTAANPLEGRLYALDTHGWRVYLTAGEHFLLIWLLVLAGVAFVAALVIDRTKRPFGSK